MVIKALMTRAATATVAVLFVLAVSPGYNYLALAFVTFAVLRLILGQDGRSHKRSQWERRRIAHQRAQAYAQRLQVLFASRIKPATNDTQSNFPDFSTRNGSCPRVRVRSRFYYRSRDRPVVV